MSAILIALVTSNFMLGCVALAVLALLVVGYAPGISLVPYLGAFVPGARVMAFVIFGLLGVLAGMRGADQRAELAQLRLDLAFKQSQLANIAATAADKARLAEASAAAAATAQQKASTYETLYLSKPAPAGDPGCDDLDPGFAAVLHGIQPRRAVKPVGANLPRLRGIGEKLFGAAR